MTDVLAGNAAASSAGAVVVDALPFRRDGDAPFPVAGAAVLLLLLGLAAWARWTASRRGAGGAVLASTAARLWRKPPAEHPSALLIASTRLGTGTALHVVAWRGTELLVGINGTSPPVVLARHPVDRATPSTIAP